MDIEAATENWSEYVTSDGSKILLRSVLVNVVRFAQYDAFGKPAYAPLSVNLMSVRAQKELRGNPTNPPPSPQELAMSTVEEVTIKPIRATPNNYKLSDGTDLTLTLAITSVKRTDKYDQLGEPMYIIESQNIIKLDVPKALYRKPPAAAISK